MIRGTYKGLRNADPIHLVEPGEFILGYPDNRGNMPPGPTLPAIADPDNRLPLVGAVGGFDRTVVENDRDLGCNGTFLVIRQLEQDVDGFKKYCSQEAERLAGPVAAALRHHRGIHRRETDRAMAGRLVAHALSIREPDRGGSVADLHGERDRAGPHRPGRPPIEAPVRGNAHP